MVVPFFYRSPGSERGSDQPGGLCQDQAGCDGAEPLQAAASTSNQHTLCQLRKPDAPESEQSGSTLVHFWRRR